MPDQRRRVTSVQVAQLSGVSRATVSYVLNGAPNQTISARTRRRVLDAAEALGYTPYAPARALRSGRSDMVLLLLPEWPIGPAIARLVEELTLALAAAGLTLVVHAHPRSARPVHELWKAITPAAVINDQALDEAEVHAARRAGIPVVAPVFQFAGGASFADFQQGIGHAQTEHLASTGHRRIGYALPNDERLAAFAGPRLAGARAACSDLGLAQPVVHTVPLDRLGAATAVRAWRRARITAVCAYNDEVALAVLAGMRACDLGAPTDLAVVGVDDIPAGALAEPALTTVATGMSTLGRHLAAAVVAVLHGEPVPQGPGPEIIRLVRRDSA